MEPKRGLVASPAPAVVGRVATTTTGVPYRTLFRWGLFVVRGAWPSFLVTTAVSVVTIGLQQLQPQLLGSVIAGLQGAGAGHAATAPRRGLAALLPGSAMGALEALAIVTVASIVGATAERLLTTWSDLQMLAELQRKLHDRLLALGPRYHSQHSVGETSAIVSRFATGAELVLRDLVASPVVRGISLVTALLLLMENVATLHDTRPALEIVLFLSVLTLPLVSVAVARRLRALFTAVRSSEVAVAEELQNSLAQPLEVQLMGATPQRSEAFARRVTAHARNVFAASSRNELAAQFQNAVPRLLQLGFLAYGTWLAAAEHQPAAAGAVVSVYGLVPLAIQPIQQLVQYYNGLNSAWPQIEKIAEILEAPPEAVEREGAVDLPEGSSGVSIEGVTFRYGAGLPPVLDQLSCAFEHGRTTALVGASGSGKSTIFNLVARLTDPEGGTVKVGGLDVRDLRIGSLRRRVVRVAQFPLFIADTVRANFQLADARASDEDIERVCRATGLWDVLVRVSGGAPLDYRLPRDVAQGLSGGQRRLLAISRALLHRPAVLLLDEPSAGIDNMTLQALTSFLRSAGAGMTVLVIDHDLEGFVARIADRICVIERGAIAASGTHAELMAVDGLYRRLVQASLEPKPETTVQAPGGPERRGEAPLASTGGAFSGKVKAEILS